MESPSLSQHQPSRNDRRKFVLAGVEYDYEELEYIENEEFCQLVMEGSWEAVTYVYQKNREFHKTDVKGRGTALHMAVNNGNDDSVKNLVAAILEHESNETTLGEETALKEKNDQGATPLHLAARRGFTNMCRIIIGENGGRNHLIQEKNQKGETPLFWAVLAGKKETFGYLHRVSPNDFNILITKKHDSILHCAIRREFLDLATLIIQCYPQLSDLRNEDEVTPLEVLATRPSAFMSGSNLSGWKLILYYCKKQYLKKIDTSEGVGNNAEDESQLSISLGPVLQTSRTLENAHGTRYSLIPPNCVTCFRFGHNIFKLIFRFPCLSRLGITGVDLKAIEKMKRKHYWGRQLLIEFMKHPYESYIGNYGDKPTVGVGVGVGVGVAQILEAYPYRDDAEKTEASLTQKEEENKGKETTFLAVAKSGIAEIINELDTKIPNASKEIEKKGLLLVAMKNIELETQSAEKIDKKETAYLAAAKTGIVEIVSALQSEIQSVIHDTNSNKENVLLVAVKNRQPLIVEELKKLDKKQLDSLVYETDDKDNNVLHLAAGTLSSNEKTWQIAGAAMQMMWDIKWYQYIKELVPGHFSYRNNKEGKTPREIFKEQHKELVSESSEWLKETSESCSVVAALIAGVSFATASTVPGGTEENGKPALEGQPAFDAFAIASLIGLCFSVTALIMFLAILTSRKQAEDFRRSLPLKLLLGLSSLFVSIASMLIAFCAGHFFVLKDKYKSILFPIYVATCLPITFYAVVQFPLYADLVKAIFKKIPPPSGRGVQL